MGVGKYGDWEPAGIRHAPKSGTSRRRAFGICPTRRRGNDKTATRVGVKVSERAGTPVVIPGGTCVPEFPVITPNGLRSREHTYVCGCTCGGGRHLARYARVRSFTCRMPPHGVETSSAGEALLIVTTV